MAPFVLAGSMFAFPVAWFFTLAWVCRASGFDSYGALLGVSIGYTIAIGAVCCCVEICLSALLYFGWREHERGKKAATQAAVNAAENNVEEAHPTITEEDCCDGAPPDCAIRIMAGVSLLLALCLVLFVEPFVVPWAVMHTDNYGDALAKMLIVVGCSVAGTLVLCVVVWVGIGVGIGAAAIYRCVCRVWYDSEARSRDYSAA